jgi:DHA1 family bicyclomycin/chloramphenicol resistance-like MFS transporter
MLIPFLVIISAVNSAIELEISAPSFPDIMQYFGASEHEVGLTITYNLAGFCVASLIYGPLSERFGRRPIMIAGNFVLMIGALACVISPSMDILLISRLVQGIGAATSAVLSTAIISDIYSARKAVKLYGTLNAIFTSIMAISPVLGGFLTYYIGWRGNYGFVALICVISWICLYSLLPETLKPELRKKSINIRSMLQDYKTLLLSPLFMSVASLPSIVYCGYMSFVTLAPFIYMDEFGTSLMTYTLHQAAIVFSFAVTSIFAGRVASKWGEVVVIKFSIYIYVFGALILTLAKEPYLFTLGASIDSIGSALIYPIIFARSVEIFPQIKGTASSAIMSLRYLICSAGTGFVIYLYKGDPIVLGIFTLGIGAIIALLSVYITRNLEF